jgi:inosose dehydratase
MTIAVANAPCSYGAFEVTVGADPNVPDGVELLDHVAAAGYEGIDLGPVGYLGTGRELHDRLAARGLVLAGGYVPLPFPDPAALTAEIGYLDELLDIFDAAPDGPPPRPTLADAGSPARRAAPGGGAYNPDLSLDETGWRNFADGVARAAARCRERGYEPAFHHHTGTYIEGVAEIERLLELTDVSLCLDTGHLLVGGGEPAQAFRDWGSRINHVHLKDAQRAIVAGIVADSAPVEEIWRRRAFCALGQGDVGMDEVLAALTDIGYAGWVIVEQDIFPDPAEPPERAAADQAANREWLRARGI